MNRKDQKRIPRRIHVWVNHKINKKRNSNGNYSANFNEGKVIEVQSEGRPFPKRIESLEEGFDENGDYLFMLVSYNGFRETIDLSSGERYFFQDNSTIRLGRDKDSGDFFLKYFPTYDEKVVRFTHTSNRRNDQPNNL